MLLEVSQVQCVLRQLVVRALPGTARPARSQQLRGLPHDVPASSPALPLEPLTGTGANTFSWFEPAFQFVVMLNSVDLYLSSFFVPQNTSACRERGASIVLFGTKLAHTHDRSVDFTHLKRDPDFASIAKFHRNCLLTVVFQFVSARRYHMEILSWFHGNPLLVESQHADPRNCPPTRAQHTNLWTVGMVFFVSS